MSADKYSGEAAQLFKPLGIYQKLPDRGYKVKGRPELGRSDLQPGFPDAFFICRHGGCMIEAKTAEITSLPFSDWRENQREWYTTHCKARGISLYLFIMFGDTITSNIWPRRAVLMDAEEFLSLEASSQRKSLAYTDVVGKPFYGLDWRGRGHWEIPPSNPFFQQFKLSEPP